MNVISERIKEARRQAGYTQERLAELIEVHPQSIKSFEGGSKRPSRERLVLIAKALAKPVGWFFSEADGYEEPKSERQLLHELADFMERRESAQACPDISQRIKQAREAAGLSIAQFADRLGWNDSFLERIEAGQKRPALETVKKLAAALGLPEGELLQHYSFGEAQPDEDFSEFGEFLRSAMHGAELDSDDLEELLGEPRLTVTNWLRGEEWPDTRQLHKLSTVLNVPASFLLGELPPEQAPKHLDLSFTPRRPVRENRVERADSSFSPADPRLDRLAALLEQGLQLLRPEGVSAADTPAQAMSREEALGVFSRDAYGRDRASARAKSEGRAKQAARAHKDLPASATRPEVEER